MSVVETFFSNGQMNAPLSSSPSARIIVAISCDPLDADPENWGIRIYSQSSMEFGEWGNDPDVLPLDGAVSAFPTAVLNDVDLLYPANELTVFWAAPSPEPSFTVRAWAVYK